MKVFSRALVALVVFVIVVGGLVVAGAWLLLRGTGIFGSSDPGPKVSFVIRKGATVEDIGGLLVRKGVIGSTLGWRIATALQDGEESIQAGRYALRQGLLAGEALDALLASKPKLRFTTVTFKEGAWLTEFAAAVGKETDISGKRFLSLARSGAIRSKLQPKGQRSLEGLLFPSTYQVTKHSSARGLLKTLVDEQEKRFSSLKPTSAARNLTPYETVIVASMIEAEAKTDADRGKVSAVIYNRLARGMRLGIDATILYGLGKREGTLTKSELDVRSPYNTRAVTGLPPTPIGAPGMASLEAAASPAEGDWLYYVVSDCDGRHAFSESYDEFLADKAHYEALAC